MSQRRAATRFLPRLDGLARTLGPSEGVERNGLRSSDVLFRQGLALNMMQHVGFIPLPFCRLASSAPGPILAVGSVGAMDGFPCHPCRDVVRGQQGWALATKTSPQDFAAGPVPVVLPNQIDRLEVCYGRLAPFSAPLYSEWNAGLESGKLLQAADAGVVGQTSESNPEIPPGLAAGAGKDMLAASSEWQGVPSGYRDCVEILRKLEARGGLGLFGPGGRATGQAGALAETLCTRWLMGSADRARVLEWPLFTRLLKKDSVVYQFGETLDACADTAQCDSDIARAAIVALSASVNKPKGLAAVSGPQVLSAVALTRKSKEAAQCPLVSCSWAV